MGRCRLAFVFALTLLCCASSAYADEKCPTPPRAPTVTWGASPSANANAKESAADESPVSKARDLMARAKFLDEVATSDERAAIDIAAKIAPLRAAAKVAREKADKATAADKVALEAKAEELETDVTVTEAEASERTKSAADNRRVARELRARAVKIVREPAAEREEKSSCDPPFRFTPDGRKIYRLECLK